MSIPFFKLRSARKKFAAVLSRLTSILKMQRDLVSRDEEAALIGRITEASELLRTSSAPDELTAAREKLERCVGEGTAWRPLYSSGWAENFEVLVVAIGVAMAFRCYFLQPFKIPTGSMQPTLYGIHSVEIDNPTIFDKHPLKIFKWFFTGDWYREVRVTAGGPVAVVSVNEKPGYATIDVAGNRYYVPVDALQERRPGCLHDLGPDGRIPAGGVLWSGRIKAGDHVFVNRVAWNFRKPRRGDVMVFSTTGIKGLQDGQHYIKRLVGLPGEAIGIRAPNLIVNGKVVTEPETIGRIARKETLADGIHSYSGYMPLDPRADPRSLTAKTPLRSEKDTAHIGQDEYLGMGDNTENSYDGRYWGTVPAKNMLGPAAFVYWPFSSSRFGLIE